MKLKTFLIILFFFTQTANAQEVRLGWDEFTDSKVTPSYTIHVGLSSRNYDRKVSLEKRAFSIKLSKLHLKPDVPNYISATADNKFGYSSEIVIIWSNNLDTDDDGLSDVLERKLKTSPNEQDTDKDGIPDGIEYVTWGPKACSLDYDKDGIANILDQDSDNDGEFDGIDYDIQKIPFVFSSSKKIRNESHETYLHLYQNQRKECPTRIGNKKVTVTWQYIDLVKARYRIYLRKKGESYNYDCWEVETSEKTGIINNLKEDVVYYAIVRAVSSSNAMGGNSNEARIYFKKNSDSPEINHNSTVSK